MLFLGGEDDREALAYVSRMMDHPRISITVVWLKSTSQKKWTDPDKSLDYELINEFWAKSMVKEWIIYREETVKDAVGTTRVLRSMEDNCDLFVVGRHHEPDSPLVLGLGMPEWSECPELGLIGDMLATSEFQFSVLVVQQQPPGPGFKQKGTRGGWLDCAGGSDVENKIFQDPSFMEDRDSVALSRP